MEITIKVTVTNTDKSREEILDLIGQGINAKVTTNLSDPPDIRIETVEPKIKVAVLGHGHNTKDILKAMAMNDKIEVVTIPEPDFAESNFGIDIPEPLDFKLTCPTRDFYPDIDIDINDGAKSGTNPHGRKKGNSKKRRKR